MREGNFAGGVSVQGRQDLGSEERLQLRLGPHSGRTLNPRISALPNGPFFNNSRNNISTGGGAPLRFVINNRYKLLLEVVILRGDRRSLNQYRQFFRVDGVDEGGAVVVGLKDGLGRVVVAEDTEHPGDAGRAAFVEVEFF